MLGTVHIVTVLTVYAASVAESKFLGTECAPGAMKDNGHCEDHYWYCGADEKFHLMSCAPGTSFPANGSGCIHKHDCNKKGDGGFYLPNTSAKEEKSQVIARTNENINKNYLSLLKRKIKSEDLDLTNEGGFENLKNKYNYKYRNDNNEDYRIHNGYSTYKNKMNTEHTTSQDSFFQNKEISQNRKKHHNLLDSIEDKTKISHSIYKDKESAKRENLHKFDADEMQTDLSDSFIKSKFGGNQIKNQNLELLVESDQKHKNKMNSEHTISQDSFIKSKTISQNRKTHHNLLDSNEDETKISHSNYKDEESSKSENLHKFDADEVQTDLSDSFTNSKFGGDLLRMQNPDFFAELDQKHVSNLKHHRNQYIPFSNKFLVNDIEKNSPKSKSEINKENIQSTNENESEGFWRSKRTASLKTKSTNVDYGNNIKEKIISEMDENQQKTSRKDSSSNSKKDTLYPNLVSFFYNHPTLNDNSDKNQNIEAKSINQVMSKEDSELYVKSLLNKILSGKKLDNIKSSEDGQTDNFAPSFIENTYNTRYENEYKPGVTVKKFSATKTILTLDNGETKDDPVSDPNNSKNRDENDNDCANPDNNFKWAHKSNPYDYVYCCNIGTKCIGRCVGGKVFDPTSKTCVIEQDFNKNKIVIDETNYKIISIHK